MNVDNLTHTELMAKRDGVTRVWVIMPGTSAKLVCDGVSFARIDVRADRTVWAKLHGAEQRLPCWGDAWRWLKGQMLAAKLAA